MKQIGIRSLMILFLTISLLGIPILSGRVASLFDYRQIDPQGVFMWISVHHIVQALFFILLMMIIKFSINFFKHKNKETKIEINFGFGLGNKKIGFNYVWIFTSAFLFYTLIGFSIALITKSFHPPWFALSNRNIFGYLGFQLFLSGPSEEILFRSFGITLLALVWNKRIIKGSLSVANLVLAIIFGLAHIAVYFSPFELEYSLFQVFYATGLGLVYGDCFEKTGSIYYPMALHSISNVIAVAASIIVALMI
jgi:membrane protease YdiL (CAAX protease family)